MNHAGGCGLKGKVLASNVIEAVEQTAMGTVKVKSVDPKAKDELLLSKVYLMENRNHCFCLVTHFGGSMGLT